MEITYESIKSLITKEEIVGGNQIHLEFCAKNQATPLPTVAMIMANPDEMKKNIAKQMAKSTAKNVAIDQLGGLIGGVGGSLFKKAGKKIANKNQDPMAMMKTEITQEKKEKAIVDAFKNFATMYKYNEQTAEWEYAF